MHIIGTLRVLPVDAQRKLQTPRGLLFGFDKHIYQPVLESRAVYRARSVGQVEGDQQVVAQQVAARRRISEQSGERNIAIRRVGVEDVELEDPRRS
jgi:hypothetical protein